MAPEMYSPRPGVARSSSLYARLLVSVLSTPTLSNLFPQVALDSSIAKIPRPLEATAFCKITGLSTCMLMSSRQSSSTSRELDVLDRVYALPRIALRAAQEQKMILRGIAVNPVYLCRRGRVDTLSCIMQCLRWLNRRESACLT